MREQRLCSLHITGRKSPEPNPSARAHEQLYLNEQISSCRCPYRFFLGFLSMSVRTGPAIAIFTRFLLLQWKWQFWMCLCWEPVRWLKEWAASLFIRGRLCYFIEVRVKISQGIGKNPANYHKLSVIFVSVKSSHYFVKPLLINSCVLIIGYEVLSLCSL